MTRCTVYLANHTSYNITFLKRRGTDWKESDGSENGSFTLLKGDTKEYEVESMGCPGRFETNHWGWLYFKATQNTPRSRFSSYFSIYLRLKDASNILEYGAGPIDGLTDNMPGDAGNPFPAGKIGDAHWDKEVPKVTIIVTDNDF